MKLIQGKLKIRRIFIEKLTGSQSRNSQNFVKYEGSYPRSQDLATGPYPEPDESGPQPHIQF
jgi:hypothetical protein